MEIPVSAYSATVAEGKMYFFKMGCPIGIGDHIHVCIYRGDKVFLFATGSSQVEKAKKRASFLKYDLCTYPVFSKNDTNLFEKDETYIDCNNPIETTPEKFAELIQKGWVYELKGHFDSESLQLIAKGVKASELVKDRIKHLF